MIHAWLNGAFGNEQNKQRCRLYACCRETNSKWFTPIHPAEMCASYRNHDFVKISRGFTPVGAADMTCMHRN
jgi:hypothetical protein